MLNSTNVGVMLCQFEQEELLKKNDELSFSQVFEAFSRVPINLFVLISAMDKQPNVDYTDPQACREAKEKHDQCFYKWYKVRICSWNSITFIG